MPASSRKKKAAKAPSPRTSMKPRHPLAHVPKGKTYGFLGAMIASTYVVLFFLLSAAGLGSTGLVKLFSYIYLFFSYTVGYFISSAACATTLCAGVYSLMVSATFILLVGFVCYLVGREIEKRDLN